KDNHHLLFRYSDFYTESTDQLNGADATFPGQITGTQGGHRWGYSIGHDWMLTNNLANEVRVGHQMAVTDFYRPARLAGPTIISNLFTDPIYSAYAQGRHSPVYD